MVILVVCLVLWYYGVFAMVASFFGAVWSVIKDVLWFGLAMVALFVATKVLPMVLPLCKNVVLPLCKNVAKAVLKVLQLVCPLVALDRFFCIPFVTAVMLAQYIFKTRSARSCVMAGWDDTKDKADPLVALLWIYAPVYLIRFLTSMVKLFNAVKGPLGLAIFIYIVVALRMTNTRLDEPAWQCWEGADPGDANALLTRVKWMLALHLMYWLPRAILGAVIVPMRIADIACPCVGGFPGVLADAVGEGADALEDELEAEFGPTRTALCKLPLRLMAFIPALLVASEILSDSDAQSCAYAPLKWVTSNNPSLQIDSLTYMVFMYAVVFAIEVFELCWRCIRMLGDLCQPCVVDSGCPRWVATGSEISEPLLRSPQSRSDEAARQVSQSTVLSGAE